MKELKDGWVKPFENNDSTNKSIRKFGKIEYGFIERKDAYCYKHKIDYSNECHLLPSGKIIWYGCPMCRDDDDLTLRRRGVPIIKPEQATELYQQPIKQAKGF